MSDESRKIEEPAEEWAPAGSAAARTGRTGKDAPELDRLPPPAFPPGSRRSALRPIPIGRAASASDSGAESGPTPADALADALISPDEPIRRRSDSSASGEDEEEYGVATGLSDEGPVYGVAEIYRSPGEVGQATRLAAESLEGLGRALRTRGAEALVVTPGTPRFDAMLRGIVAGYLAGKGEGSGGGG